MDTGHYAKEDEEEDVLMVKRKRHLNLRQIMPNHILRTD